MCDITLIALDGFGQREGHRRGTYWDLPRMSHLRSAAYKRGLDIVFPEMGINWTDHKAKRLADNVLEGGIPNPVFMGFSDGGKAAIAAAHRAHAPFVAYAIAAVRRVPRDPLPGLFVVNDRDKLTHDTTAETYARFYGDWGAWVDFREVKDRRPSVKRRLHRHYWLPSANPYILEWAARAAAAWYGFQDKLNKMKE